MSFPKSIPAILLAFLAIACSQQKEAAQDLTNDLVGEWSNTYLNITIHGDSVFTRVADSTNWAQNLGIKPIHTFFQEDGSYRSEYRNLKDSLVRVATGTWKIAGDTLTMTQIAPEATTYRMHTTLRGNKVIFEGIIDFDGDGQKDDHYLGWQKKH